MAPPSTVPSKTKSNAKSKPSKAAAHRKSTSHTPLGVTKPVSAKKKHRRPLNSHELASLEKTLPALNTVVPPMGNEKKRGGKKGKVFIDDHDLDKMHRMIEKAAMGSEGIVESKLEKARRLEIIREARRKEDEKRRERKEDERKIRTKRGRKRAEQAAEESMGEERKKKGGKGKKVAFALAV